MAEEKTFSKEERIKIAQKFRDEIKAHGLPDAILSVATSTSEKTAIRKEIFVQQCRKKNFVREFIEACDRLISNNYSVRLSVLNLKREILG